MPDRFDDVGEGYAYVRTIFEQVSSGERPPTVSITPSTRHVGMTRRDTHRPNFEEAVRVCREEGYPVLVRASGGGAIAAGGGTFGFSMVRPSTPEEGRRGTQTRYDEAASLVLASLKCLGVEGAEAGEVKNEFCPGDHSIRVGGYESGMKLVGIAQRVTKRATSVGGIVLVSGEEDLARILTRVYDALDLPFRPESVGSLRRAGSGADTQTAMQALAEEARFRYGAVPVTPDEHTMELARSRKEESLVRS